MRFRMVGVLGILVLMIGSTPVARADIITEGVIASRCAEVPIPLIVITSSADRDHRFQ